MKEGRPLRIMIATGIFWPSVGGPAQQTELYRRAFEREGHIVRIVTYAIAGSDREDGSVSYLDGSRSTNPLSKLVRQFALLCRLWQIFSRFRPDVVHSQTASGPLPFLVGLVARIRGVPSWVKIANDPEFDHSGRAGLSSNDIVATRRPRRTAAQIANAALTRTMLKLYRFVWVTTPTLADRMNERWNVSRSRIYVESNRFDFHKLSDVAEARKLRCVARPTSLLIVSRLEPIKGIDIALEAIALVEESVTLRVLGDGSPENRAFLEDFSRELGLENRVHWLGAVEPDYVADHFRDADILIVPSRFEAFGNVIVEAMAAGTPVIASDVGGIPFVTQGDTCATLVPPDNPAELADAIEWLLRHDDIRQQRIEAGRRRVRDFSIEAGVDRWADLFEANLKARACP